MKQLRSHVSRIKTEFQGSVFHDGLLVSDKATYRVDPVWTAKSISTCTYVCLTCKGFLYHKVPNPKKTCQYKVVFYPVSQPFCEITCQICARMYLEGCRRALVRGPLRGTLMTGPPPATSVIHWHPNQHLCTCSCCRCKTNSSKNKQILRAAKRSNSNRETAADILPPKKQYFVFS